MSWKIIISALTLILTGCAATTSIVDKSKTIDEYLDRTSITTENGERIYDQYAMKAALIIEIIENTQWPDGKKNAVKLCVIDDDDFRGKLNKMVAILKKEKNYTIEVKRGISESNS